MPTMECARSFVLKTGGKHIKDCKTYRPGDPIDVDEKDVAEMVRTGMVREPEAKAVKPAPKPAPPAATVAKPKGKGK